MKKLISIIIAINLIFFILGIIIGLTIIESLLPLFSQIIIVLILGFTYDSREIPK